MCQAVSLTTSSDLLFKFAEAAKPVNLTLSKGSKKAGYEAGKLLCNLKRGNAELVRSRGRGYLSPL
jgi:hypothetical protein